MNCEHFILTKGLIFRVGTASETGCSQPELRLVGKCIWLEIAILKLGTNLKVISVLT